MTTIVFVHGMFQNPKSWTRWVGYFSRHGFECVVPAWPLHDGDPAELRESPPPGLGELSLDDVVATMQRVVGNYDRPVMIGHSVGGLVTQLLVAKGLLSAGVAISSVAPNRMLEFDWGFIKNAAIIANPLKGDEPVFMDAKTFHRSFANSLSKADAALAFEETATHDSRNVLRDCMGGAGRIDLECPHSPLLLIGGERDEIIPSELNEKNYKAYKDVGSVTDFLTYPGRSHFICNEPGWEEVAGFVYQWVERNTAGRPAI
ncbi:pimeloyl-ACP methyl ester carboxylesterase [Rhizobium sp. BK181]|uniref:alpha/beta hydrolase n=1 Tax=Rhizobium sp. BK181 TaxID=2587072 RepID=UPI00161C73CD|nr:alpha/beta hydrolase [Rhizobium sp. BK181]MBB3319612.1 pimeloyl-ACP methyl ester carboxylesterase [Rhizobium sp. BK181]